MKKLNFIGIGGATNIDFGGNCCYLKEQDNLLIIDACESATEKLILMHFDTPALYEKIVKEGFNVATIEEINDK